MGLTAFQSVDADIDCMAFKTQLLWIACWGPGRQNDSGTETAVLIKALDRNGSGIPYLKESRVCIYV